MSGCYKKYCNCSPQNVWHNLNCNNLNLISSDNSITIVKGSNCTFDLTTEGGGGGGTGTVTSVGLSMPAAFNVIGSPITSSGVISVIAAGSSSQYVRGDGTLATFPVINSGTVTSVGLTVPAAFSVAGSPITGAGVLAISAIGTSTQYIRGDGTLATFPVIPTVTSFTFTDGNGFDGTVTNSSTTPALSLTTTLTTGSVPFITTGGALAQDNTNFNFNDATNELFVPTVRSPASTDLTLRAATLQKVSIVTGGLERIAVNNGGAIVFNNGADAYTFPFTIGTAGQVLTDPLGDGTLAWTTISGGGGTYTFDNGLTLTAFNAQLGGTLLQDTVIDAGSAFSLTVAGTGGGIPFKVTSDNNISGQFTSQTSIAVQGTAGDSFPAGHFTNSTPYTDSVIDAMHVQHQASGSPASLGIGVAIRMNVSNDTGLFETNRLISKWTDITHATRTSSFELWGVNSGVSARKLAVAGSGQLTLDTYGDGTHTGTATFALASDTNGNIIEVALSGVGAPAATKVQFQPGDGGFPAVGATTYDIGAPNASRQVLVWRNGIIQWEGDPGDGSVYITKSGSIITFSMALIADEFIQVLVL